MYTKLLNFLRDDSGLETVEWAIVGGVIVAVGATIFVTIGQDASQGLQNLQNETATLSGGGGGGGGGAP